MTPAEVDALAARLEKHAGDPEIDADACYTMTDAATAIRALAGERDENIEDRLRAERRCHELLCETDTMRAEVAALKKGTQGESS